MLLPYALLFGRLRNRMPALRRKDRRHLAKRLRKPSAQGFSNNGLKQWSIL